MNRMDEFDALRREDWSTVYRDVPPSVNEGVQLAFERIRAHERRRRQGLRMISLAACLCLVLGAGALVLNRGAKDAPDRVATPSVKAWLLANDSIVYASKEDGCFHMRADCSDAKGEMVELQLVTALEFEKHVCPTCGANVLLPE